MSIGRSTSSEAKRIYEALDALVASVRGGTERDRQALVDQIANLAADLVGLRFVPAGDGVRRGRWVMRWWTSGDVGHTVATSVRRWLVDRGYCEPRGSG